MFGSLSNFQQRFLFGFLGIIVIACLIFFSHVPPLQYLFIAAIALVQAIALWEYYQIAKEKEIEPKVVLGIIFSLLYVLLHSCKVHYCLHLFLFAFMVATFISFFKMHANAIANVGITFFGIIYITIPLCFLIDLNFAKTGSSFWIIYLIVITKITDTCAYFAGKSYGKHAFAPVLSPKKTWEGAFAGLIGASLASLAFYRCMQGFSILEALLLGLCLGVFAQAGDLAESLLKRDAQVKDSNKLPGFGGFLDIVDSLIFTTPLLFFWLKLQNLL